MRKFALLLVALCLVGMVNGEAMAADWEVVVDMAWFTQQQGGNQRDVNVTAQLYTATMAPIGNPVALDATVQWDYWEGTLNDGGDPPTFVIIRFDYDPVVADDGEEWTNDNGNGGDPINGYSIDAEPIGCTQIVHQMPEG